MTRLDMGRTCLWSLGVLGAIALLVIGLRPLARDSDPPPQIEEARLEALRTLPYLTWIDVPEGDEGRANVTLHNEALVQPGVNLFNSRNQAAAHLVNLAGTVLHSWEPVLPDGASWHVVAMDPDGNLYAIEKDRMLLKVSWDSEILWKKAARYHHDISFDEAGRIYTLLRVRRGVALPEGAIPLLEDRIEVRRPDGTRCASWSVFDLLREVVPAAYFAEASAYVRRKRAEGLSDEAIAKPGSLCDPLHVNSVQVVPRRIAGVAEAGDLLVSARQIDRVAVIRPSEARLVWSWGPGELDKQHHATVLENGHFLIFDNQPGAGASRIVEIDPRTREIAWQYPASAPERFFSSTRGSAQRLPNGNTLVTESNRGCVFEIAPSGERVWEFFNPVFRGNTDKPRKRAAIYRCGRIVDERALRGIDQRLRGPAGDEIASKGRRARRSVRGAR